MDSLTVFSWGYWGWGTATEQLIQAVDAVEASRGFDPPVFVDIRYRRSGRAPGFVGDEFKMAVGSERYVWIQDLGNTAIQQGGEMRIMNPAASHMLLDLAIKEARSNRRIIYYCACELPGTQDEPYCHRTVVAGLLLESAHVKQVAICVIEWPGGEISADQIQVEVPQQEYTKLVNGKKSIPIKKPFVLGEIAGLPHFALVEVRAIGNRLDSSQYISGPARYKHGNWYLPALGEVGKDESLSTTLAEIHRLRELNGYAPRLA